MCYIIRSTRSKSVFESKGIVVKLADTYDTYVVPADKASNNIVFVLKQYHIQCLIK